MTEREQQDLCVTKLKTSEPGKRRTKTGYLQKLRKSVWNLAGTPHRHFEYSRQSNQMKFFLPEVQILTKSNHCTEASNILCIDL